MGYLDEVLGINATGGHAAPAENLEEDKITSDGADFGYEEFLDFDEIDSLLLAEMEEEEKTPPPGYHYMPDGRLMRDDEHETEAATENPCWEGYVQVGMKMKDGKEVPNCVPADEAAAILATAGSKPAAPSERRKGSSKNKKGSASGGKKITFSKKVTESLQKKADDHNEKHGDSAGKKTSVSTLKAVYRRGAGAFSTSHRPDQNRNSWAMARVNAFLHLLRNGKPKSSKYVQDNDLLPKAHPKSTR